MKKLLILLLLLPFFAKAQTPYQLNYDSIRVNKTAGTGGTSLYGKVYLKNVSARAVGDSILTVVNGRIFKVPYNASVLSVGAIGASPNANAATISGTVLNLEPASASFGGVVTTGTQTFAGDKSWIGKQSITYGASTAAALAVSHTADARAISALANTSGSLGVAPFAAINLGEGRLAEFSNSAGTKVQIYNNGTIITDGKLGVLNTPLGTGGTDSVIVKNYLSTEFRTVGTTGTGSAVFSDAPTLTSATFTSTGGFIQNTGASTSTKAVRIENTGGSNYSGVESSTGGNIFIGSSAYAGVIGTTASTPFEIATLNNVRYSISSSGNHDFKSGTATFGGALTGTAATFSGALSLNTNTNYILWGTNAVVNPYIQGGATNELYIGTGNANGITMSSSRMIQLNAYGAGTLTTDASGNVTATSDSTWKEQFKPFTRGLADLKTLKPVKYHWTAKSGLDTLNEYTYFKAQDVQKVIPEAVFPAKEGQPLGVQDRPIIATMINAINELNAKIEELEARIKLLEDK
jgi:hypothetical protein